MKPTTACFTRSCSIKLEVAPTRQRCEGIGKVRHVHQLLTTATVEQETMQKPELSRLKGAPSMCVCSVRHMNEETVMRASRHEMRPDTMKSSKIPISGCHASTCSTKSRQKQMSPQGKRKSEKIVLIAWWTQTKESKTDREDHADTRTVQVEGCTVLEHRTQE